MNAIEPRLVVTAPFAHHRCIDSLTRQRVSNEQHFAGHVAHTATVMRESFYLNCGLFAAPQRPRHLVTAQGPFHARSVYTRYSQRNNEIQTFAALRRARTREKPVSSANNLFRALRPNAAPVQDPAEFAPGQAKNRTLA